MTGIRCRTMAAVTAALFLALAPLGVGAQTDPAAAVEEDRGRPRGVDPIATAAYGKLFDAEGNVIHPTAEFLQRTLRLYIDRLLGEADEPTRAAYEKHQTELAERFPYDALTPRFLLLEWLAEAVAPPDKAHLYAKNRTMRIAWYKRLLGEERYYEIVDKASGLPRDIAKLADERGMLRKATSATGREYIEECRRAGVPIPPTWGEEGPNAWQFVGNLTTNFVGSGNPASVYRFDSTSPPGICVALPRINGNTISLLGIICLGRETNNACFYDNMGVSLDEKVAIEDFLSGGNLGDVCSDCHAGENPYVVHPGSPLDMAPDHWSTGWHAPLVRADWPQNPGPLGLLAQVPINPLPPENDGSCLLCHKPFQDPGSAGRFPDVLALNQVMMGLVGSRSGYCRTVVENAIGNTMPGLGGPYDTHAQAMLSFCKQTPRPGEEVPPPDVRDDPGVLSPPIVVGPLYACAEAIEVRGGVRDAKLTVTVGATALPPVTVTTPSRTIVATAPLVAGDVVQAVQEFDGQVSDPSQPVVVIDHTVAYPSGLPAPEIDPTLIHECGRTIAVRHVRGAKVTVLTNGGDDVTYTTAGDWTNLPPKIRPFNLGDRYTARQQMCTDTSGLSAQQAAGPPPSPMPTPEIDPTPPIAGQQLVDLSNLANGALTVVSESSAGDLAQFSTAVSWKPEVDIATALGRPLDPGDQLAVTSELCDTAKVAFPEARPCERLPAPAIAPPLVGATSVHVTSAVPGARIFVYDAALNEIGDGSGAEVGLTRAIVAGDVLIVTQRLGRCASSAAFQIGAVCASLEDDCG